ncbi:MAG: hypothetical protein ACM359_07520 [Bacillota bacterium]
MKTGCRFIGDKGWVQVDRSGVWAEPQSLLKLQLKEDEPHLYKSDNHQDNFLQCVKSWKDPVSNVEAMYKASYMGLIAGIAGRLKAKLKWDPAKEQFVGNEEANRLLKRPMQNGWSL